MASRSDSSLASLLLVQRMVDAGAVPLKASEYWDVVEAVDDPAKLLGLDVEENASTSGAGVELSERSSVCSTPPGRSFSPWTRPSSRVSVSCPLSTRATRRCRRDLDEALRPCCISWVIPPC